MFRKDDVQRLITDIGETKNASDSDNAAAPRNEADRPQRYIGNRDVETHQLPGAVAAIQGGIDLSGLEIGEPYMFGLALDVFDPISGQIFAVCRPSRMGVAEGELFLTLRQLGAEVASARMARRQSDRAAGIVNPADPEAVAAAEKAEAAREAWANDKQPEPVA